MLVDVKAAKKRHRSFLLGLPNVVALGVGPKVTAGTKTGVMAIKVFVSRKVPESLLAEDERVPDEIDGVPVDVELMAPLRAQTTHGGGV